MNRQDDLDRLLVAVKELTEERSTVDQVIGWSKSRHRERKLRVTKHDPLLVELACSVTPSGSQDDAGARTVPGSRPAANLDAIDRLEAIRAAVRLWCDRLDVERRAFLADTLRGLLGAQGRMSDDELCWLARDAAQWVTWAQVVTGWATPPFAPHVPCPACERVGGLRIRDNPKVGCCLTCGADWREDDGGIYVLADHIRLMTEGESA